MPFDQQSYANHLRASGLAEQRFGPGWMSRDLYSTMDDPFNLIEAQPYSLKNPASTGRWMTIETRDPDGARAGSTQQFVPWGTTPDPSIGYWNGERDSAPAQWESLRGKGPQGGGGGWDRNKYGNIEDYYSDPTDPNKITADLPDGGSVQAYLDQLNSFAWPSYSSAPSSNDSVGGFLMDAMKSPGIAPVLAAAGIGSFLGSGGAASSGWTSGYDLAGGGSFGGSGGLADFVGSDWASGLQSAMNPGSGGMNIEDLFSSWESNAGQGPFSTTGGGTDFVGSDWASGDTGAMNPGMNAAGSNPIQSLIRQLMGQAGGGGTGQLGSGIANLLSGASGLFDLFSGSPLSARGINEAAATTADPLRGDRGMYGGMLKNLMTNPGSFNLTPGAKFVMDTGTENLTRSNAARGMLGSGNILADIMKFGEGVASTDYYNTVDRLGQFSGATTGSPAAAGQIQSGQLAARNNALANIGGGLAPVPGNATNTGGGVLQALGGIGSGISSIFNLFK